MGPFFIQLRSAKIYVVASLSHLVGASLRRSTLRTPSRGGWLLPTLQRAIRPSFSRERCAMFLLAIAAILCIVLFISAISAIRVLIYVGSGRQALDDRLRAASEPTR